MHDQSPDVTTEEFGFGYILMFRWPGTANVHGMIRWLYAAIRGHLGAVSMRACMVWTAQARMVGLTIGAACPV